MGMRKICSKNLTIPRAAMLSRQSISAGGNNMSAGGKRFAAVTKRMEEWNKKVPK